MSNAPKLDELIAEIQAHLEWRDAEFKDCKPTIAHTFLLRALEALRQMQGDAKNAERWKWVLDNATRSAMPAFNAKTGEQTGLFLQLTFPIKGASPWATQDTLNKAIDSAIQTTKQSGEG